MREIVGVFVHKETWELLGHGRRDDARAQQLREQVVESANRARNLQRALDKEANLLVLDQLLRDRPGPHRGTVVGLTPPRAYVLLDDPPVDLKVDLKAITPAVRLARDEVTVTGQDGSVFCRLGDAVDVTATSRDKGRRWWNLALRRAGEG